MPPLRQDVWNVDRSGGCHRHARNIPAKPNPAPKACNDDRRERKHGQARHPHRSPDLDPDRHRRRRHRHLVPAHLPRMAGPEGLRPRALVRARLRVLRRAATDPAADLLAGAFPDPPRRPVPAAYGSDLNLVANPIGRYSIRDGAAGLGKDPDGGLTIYLQAESPGKEKEANWLPCPPDGEWFVILRVYLPRPEVIKAEWECPPIEPVN